MNRSRDFYIKKQSDIMPLKAKNQNMIKLE